MHDGLLAGLRNRGGQGPVATRGVLVYPVGAGPQPGRFDVTWARVNAATPQPISLHVLPWYVGPGLEDRIDEILSELRHLRRGDAGAEAAESRPLDGPGSSDGRPSPAGVPRRRDAPEDARLPEGFA